jgi:hypothetical protein
MIAPAFLLTPIGLAREVEGAEAAALRHLPHESPSLLSLSETYALKYWWCSPPRTDAESLTTLKRSFVDLKLLAAPPDMSALYTEAFLPK